MRQRKVILWFALGGFCTALAICRISGLSSSPSVAAGGQSKADTKVNTSEAPRRPNAPTPKSYKDSPAVAKLRREAQSVQPLPIKDIPTPYGTGETQGTNLQSADGKSWEVYHMVGPSENYNYALVAHELTHIILNSKGLGTLFRVKPNQGEEVENVLQHIGRVIGPDCFPDELIDRETAKRGFHPLLLMERQMQLEEQGLAVDVKPGDLEVSPDLNRTFEAATLFCIGRRLPAKTMNSFERRVERIYGPTIMDRERKLTKQFAGQRCHIDDAIGCFKLKLKLRDALKLHDLIVFRNPMTGQPE